MITVDSTQEVDMARYIDYATQLGEVYVDSILLQEEHQRLQLEVPELLWKLQLGLQTATGNPFAVMDAYGTIVRDILIDIYKVPSKYFLLYSNGEKKLSMDRTRILEPLLQELESHGDKICINPDEAILLLKEHIYYRKMSWLISNIAKKITKMTPTAFVNKAGHPLLAASFEYGVADTGRICTHHDNIQGWHPVMSKTITAKEGYFLVWMDLDQIDLRVAYNYFLHTPDLDEIFNQYPDAYEAVARIIYKSLGKPFDLTYFKEHRQVFKKLILAKIYRSGDSIGGPAATEFSKQINEFLEINEGYSQYTNICKDYIRFGFPLNVVDYFGFTRLIDPSLYQDAISPMINTPIQATSKNILAVVILRIIDSLLNLGYEMGTDIIFYLDRHDEVVFMFSNRVKKDLWVLQDCSEVYLDDWKKLNLEIEIGDTYKCTNSQYMEEFAKCCVENAAKMNQTVDKTIATGVGAKKHKNYAPLKSIAVVIEPLQCTNVLELYDRTAREVGYLTANETFSKDLPGSDFRMQTAVKSVEEFKQKYSELLSGIEQVVNNTQRYVIDLSRSIAFKYDTKTLAKSLDDIGETLHTNNIIRYGYNVPTEVCNNVMMKPAFKSGVSTAALILKLEKWIPTEMKYYKINADQIRDCIS